MSLSLLGPQGPVRTGFPAVFTAQGGVTPYVYSCLNGTIDSSTGAYTAPATQNYANPAANTDTITVTDSTTPTPLTATITTPILEPIGLVCDIIQNGMGLSNGQVYFYNQKILVPIDSQLYIAVGVQSSKPFGNVSNMDSDANENQYVNVCDTLKIDILSRTVEALYRKEQVLMALRNTYSQQQQSAYAMKLARLSTQFVNLSEIDGPAIPYRFNISVSLIYAKPMSGSVPYFSDFNWEITYTEP